MWGTDEEAGHMSLEFGKDGWAGDTDVRVVGLEVIFKRNHLGRWC